MTAILYLLFSVLTWSFLPLFAALGLEKIDKWDFVVWTEVIGLASSWVLLWIMASRAKVTYPKLKELSVRTHIEYAFCGLTYIISIVCLWTSFFYISKAGATIIFEIWPILSMFLTPLLIKKGWENLTPYDFIYGILAFVGMAFILAPELEQPFFLQQKDPVSAFMILILPFLGGIFMAVTSVLKARLSYHMEIKGQPLVSLLVVQVYYGIYACGFAAVAYAIVRMSSEQAVNNVYDLTIITGLLVVGIIIYTLGRLTYVMGLLKSTKSNIIALWYFMPIFSVFWLYLAGLSAITPHIIIGAASIICANLLITIRADERISYSAAIISLLLVGLFCFFVNGMEMGDYYQAVSVPLIFYAIIVSFLMDRLIKRDTFEEGLALELIKHVQTGIEKAHLSHKTILVQNIMAIIQTNESVKIAQHYDYLRNDVKEMQPMQDRLDALALSRVEGVNFAEIFVLSLIGMLTIMMTVLYRPASFTADCFAIVLTLSVVFVFFTVVDLVKKRRTFNLKVDEYGRFNLTDKVLKNFTGERVISTLMIFLVAGAFIFLMWLKHHR